MGAAVEKRASITASGNGWQVERTAHLVRARFEGRLLAAEGPASAQALVEAVGSDQVTLVFDIRKMAGYDSAARHVWARRLRPIRAQIVAIELRGGNALVRMGGSVLGAMLGVPVTTAS